MCKLLAGKVIYDPLSPSTAGATYGFGLCGVPPLMGSYELRGCGTTGFGSSGHFTRPSPRGGDGCNSAQCISSHSRRASDLAPHLIKVGLARE